MPPRLRWPMLASRRRNGPRQGTRQTLATSDKPAPRQPNERDESSDAHDDRPRPRIEQAARDLKNGLEDTDCRNRVGEVVPEATSSKKD